MIPPYSNCYHHKHYRRHKKTSLRTVTVGGMTLWSTTLNAIEFADFWRPREAGSVIAQKVHDMSTGHSMGPQAVAKDVWAVDLEL